MKKYMLLLPMMVNLGFVNLCFSQSQTTTTPSDIAKEIQTGHEHEAEKLLKEVLQKNKNSAKVHYMLSKVYYTKGEYDKAQNELKIAKQLDPSESFANKSDLKNYENELSNKLYEEYVMAGLRDSDYTNHPKSSTSEGDMNDEEVKDFLFLLLAIGILTAIGFPFYLYIEYRFIKETKTKLMQEITSHFDNIEKVKTGLSIDFVSLKDNNPTKKDLSQRLDELNYINQKMMGLLEELKNIQMSKVLLERLNNPQTSTIQYVKVDFKYLKDKLKDVAKRSGYRC